MPWREKSILPIAQLYSTSSNDLPTTTNRLWASENGQQVFNWQNWLSECGQDPEINKSTCLARSLCRYWLHEGHGADFQSNQTAGGRLVCDIVFIELTKGFYEQWSFWSVQSICSPFVHRSHWDHGNAGIRIKEDFQFINYAISKKHYWFIPKRRTQPKRILSCIVFFPSVIPSHQKW